MTVSTPPPPRPGVLTAVAAILWTQGGLALPASILLGLDLRSTARTAETCDLDDALSCPAPVEPSEYGYVVAFGLVAVALLVAGIGVFRGTGWAPIVVTILYVLILPVSALALIAFVAGPVAYAVALLPGLGAVLLVLMTALNPVVLVAAAVLVWSREARDHRAELRRPRVIR